MLVEQLTQLPTVMWQCSSGQPLPSSRSARAAQHSYSAPARQLARGVQHSPGALHGRGASDSARLAHTLEFVLFVLLGCGHVKHACTSYAGWAAAGSLLWQGPVHRCAVQSSMRVPMPVKPQDTCSSGSSEAGASTAGDCRSSSRRAAPAAARTLASAARSNRAS